jgi:Flp pilus assembly pilin Flp
VVQQGRRSPAAWSARVARSATKQGEGEMVSFMRKFWQEESGQDLIEYTLLLAFVALASASLFLSAGNSVGGIWGSANSQLVAANTTS